MSGGGWGARDFTPSLSADELDRRGFHAAAEAKRRREADDFYMGEAARWRSHRRPA